MLEHLITHVRVRKCCWQDPSWNVSSETKASTILLFFDGLHGEVQVTFEEETWAAWLYDLLKPHVTKLVVCDPRRNATTF